jgi:hypothetical protein
VKVLSTAVIWVHGIVFVLVFTLISFAQDADAVPTFRVDAKSALVWDEDSPLNGTSFVIRDPLTGNEIHRLSAGGVEVSSLVGYERVSSSRTGKLLNYTTTIANNTDSDLSVRYGGASVDEHTSPPLSVALTNKGVKKRDRKDTWEASKMYCFKNGFASNENVFSARTISKSFTVRPKTAMTISSVTMDPRSSSVLCSVDGCHIKGTIRYYITVNRKDYVFVWPGHSVVYCGE